MRVAAASEWVDRAQFVPIVWADEIEAPRNTSKLEVQDFILGPRARQRLLTAKAGRDPAFREWLARTYGGRLPDAFGAGAKDRERAVNRLVDSLQRDDGATGFAVLDAKGRILGVELFHQHELMVALAPRLLRGYLLEAGEDEIRLAAPRVAGRGIETVKGFLGELKGRGLRVERKPLEDGRSDGLSRANIVGSAGEIVGHGLVLDETPIHLSLFSE
jgi:hypothetical protein